MDATQVRQIVRDVLATVLQRPIEPGAEVSQLTEPEWDSARHAEVFAMLEQELGVTFTDEDFVDADSLARLEATALARTGAGASD